MLPDHLCESKYAEVLRLQALADAGNLPEAQSRPRPDFRKALRRRADMAALPVIAEFKRASPSRGIINADLTPEDVAAQYAQAGAACVSVLTEEYRFHGRLDFLARMAEACRQVPLLRKDFIFHPLQILETASTPASALLLIVRLTPSARTLRELREQAEQYGMEAVVEVFDSDELALARQSGARIIQANARDLNTMAVDRAACLRLAEKRGGGNDEIWIAASGMETPEHLRQAAEAGYDAALVGTVLMRGGQPGAALRRLREGAA